jgi:CheY-like chemotaxis protein
VQREALRILVADDHDAMRQCVVCVLSINFLVIGAVSDGSELVEAAVCLKPDLIVSDVRMPRLNGTEAMNKLRAVGINIPFVFISCDKYLAKDLVLRGDVCIHEPGMSYKLEDATLAQLHVANEKVSVGLLCIQRNDIVGALVTAKQYSG